MNRLASFLMLYTVLITSFSSHSANSGVVFNINPFSRFIGAFGGDISCPNPTLRTPIVLIHGNADSSLGWTKENNKQKSFVDQLKDVGYTNCGIFAVSYLSLSEQLQPSKNYHEQKKLLFIKDYIETVLKTTGQQKIDIVSHSLGVTISLETLHRYKLFKNVRKFVAIAGAMQGLESCLKSGPNSVSVATCSAVRNKKKFEFGFWPDQMLKIENPRMGSSTQGFSRFPELYLDTTFYSISAGLSDEVVCANQQGNNSSKCQKSSYFSDCTKASCNVASEVLIGKAPNFIIAIGARSLGGDIADGIGHMRARDLAGPIVSEMLTSQCKGIQCCANYNNSCSEKLSFNNLIK